MSDETHIIGKLNESSLHNSLKYHYSSNPENHERKVMDYIVDILTDNEIIEIQTANLGSIRKKLSNLVKRSEVRLVYPLPVIKYIVKFNNQGKEISRRKSPKTNTLFHSFRELLRVPHLLNHPNFKLEVLFTEEEEHWIDDGKGSWRRKGWSRVNRKLLAIQSSVLLAEKTDFLDVFPEELPDKFTTSDIHANLNIPKHQAQQLCYTYRKAGFIEQIGKQGRSHLYQVK